jgi:N-acetylmuramoyl-L-alanine amidase
MNRALLLTLTASLLAAPGAWGSVEDSYQAAREGYWKLKKDEDRRGLRHHWLKVVKRLEAVATGNPKSDRAPEAWFLCGEALGELSRSSGQREDLDGAIKAYQQLLEGWPKHRLADDGALALARLYLDRKGQPRAARKVVEAALPGAKDQKKDLAALLASLAAPSKGTRKDGTSRMASPPERPPADKRRAVAAVVARPAPTKEAAPRVDRAVVAQAQPLEGTLGLASGAQLADAIHRAVQPLGQLELRLPSDELPMQARRAPAARPAEEAVAVRADVALARDDSDVDSTIVSLQEQLRDFRVGASPPAEDPAVRAQLRAMTKAEQGGEVTLAQQLGLKVRRVVIDAGHGGRDAGAIGPDGTREKDVALAIATKLARRLEAMGLEVVLTRDDDRFVTLEDRTRIANQKKGDLFISVHCNAAASKSLRGIETYTLNTSSNRYSIRLAARENATSERGVGDLRYILADLATRANTSESSRLARQVQRSLVTSLSTQYAGVRDLGTKEALFFVLLGAKMPAILVETSFISHPEEEKRLAKPEYQGKVADSIAQAVAGFLEDRARLTQVD